MTRWITIGSVLLLAVAAAIGAYVLFNSREKYEKAYAQAKSHTLVEMNAEAEAFLDNVRTNWRRRSESLDGDGPIMAEFGLEPTIANWVEVQTWKIPRFSYWNYAANLRNSKFMVLQATLLMVAEDGKVYVKPDRSAAFVRPQSDMVYFFENDPAGIRQSIYVRSRP